jgi:hypothetical protein
MKDYKVVFVGDKIGRSAGAQPVVFEQVEDLEQLTNRVEKHARKFLMSQDVGCFIENNITRHGKVFAGVRPVAEFDFTVTRIHGTGKPNVVDHGDGNFTISMGDPGTAGLGDNVVRCSWDHDTEDHCTDASSGVYRLWGKPRELCEEHGRRSEGRVDESELSADRPCDWLAGGKCNKPSANVRWVSDGGQVLRWHCPEHTPKGIEYGWLVKEEVPF